MRLKNDKRLRDRLFTAESYQHPAKGHLGLWQAIIEKYTQPGDTILDPMSGVGATLTAALMGRNVIAVELEPHFVAPMKASWEKMRQHPMLGHTLGEVLILRGDARHLPIASADQFTNGPLVLTSEVQGNDGQWTSKTYRFAQVRLQDAVDADNAGTIHPSDAGGGAIDSIITSPPWEDKTALQDSKWLYEHEAELAERFRQSHASEKGLPGNTKPENRTTMERYTRPSAIITSPPYEASLHEGQAGPGATSDAGAWHEGRETTRASYTRPVDAVVTSPPYANRLADTYVDDDPQRMSYAIGKARIDAVVSSPPFQDQEPFQDHSFTPPHDKPGFSTQNGYQGQQENIGNLRGQAYFDSMRQVYSECHRVLRPGGIMALVLKGFTRDGQYVDLPQDTATLCESLGFTLVDTWQRELWSLSFWRILQKRRDPAAFDDRLNFESVMAFRKE